jgi:hypothetical protein
MKKIISVLLSVVMLVSVSAVSFSAFAETVGSYETTKKTSKITVEVNGSTSKDVTYKADPDDPAVITFSYDGSGTLDGWDFEGMVEGVDYEVVSIDGNSITIRLLNDYDGDIEANAVVSEKEDDTKTTTKAPKKDDKGKSPKTGAATATGLAAAGAGAAILLALRKKEDAE